MSTQVIVIGGGLSGLSAAHTVLERGGSVLVLEKNPFMGGNSVKATSGINGALTKTQVKLGIYDSEEKFAEDTALSASKGKSKVLHPLGKVLVQESAPSVDWLVEKFGLDLTKIGRLGGHSYPRTHRGGEKFPGMTITYALMEKFEKIEKESKGKLAKVLTKTKATKLLTKDGAVVGCEYVTADGKTQKAYGPVVIATGGYAADFSDDGLLMQMRPDLKNYPTTNGPHTTGDGIKMARAVGADWVDMDFVQVHPTGLVNPKDPNSKTLWLAAEALRGTGGIILNKKGERFCDELGRRDYVSGEMEKNEGPFYLLLNKACSKEIMWHCKHYKGRGIMNYYKNGKELARGLDVSESKLQSTFDKYKSDAKAKKDAYGKKFFKNADHFTLDSDYYVGIVKPVVHYCMGGLTVDTDGAVLNEKGKRIPGLFGAGEVNGGIHGKNRLGGSSLLDCVVFGRVSGAAVSKYLLESFSGKSVSSSSSNFGFYVKDGDVKTEVTVNPSSKTVQIQFGSGVSSTTSVVESTSPQTTEEPKVEKVEEKKEEKKEAQNDKNRLITREEVAKHTKRDDCWVVVNGVVLDVTKFLKDHPGGVDSIMLFAGKDASEEFNMLHEANVIEKYAPYVIIGKVADGQLKSKL